MRGCCNQPLMGPIPRARLPRAGHGAAAFHKGSAGASRLEPRGETGAEGSPREAGKRSRLSESLPINFTANCSGGKTKATINREVWFVRQSALMGRGSKRRRRSLCLSLGAHRRDRGTGAAPAARGHCSPPRNLHVKFSAGGGREKIRGKGAREACVMRRGGV